MSIVKIKVSFGIVQGLEYVHDSEDVHDLEDVHDSEDVQVQRKSSVRRMSTVRRMSKFGDFPWSECVLGFRRMFKGFKILNKYLCLENGCCKIPRKF